MLATTSLEVYLSSMDEKDMSLIRLSYFVPNDFKLELLGLSARANDSSLSHFKVYEEALVAGLQFSLSPFILDLHHLYGIFFLYLDPKLLRAIG